MNTIFPPSLDNSRATHAPRRAQAGASTRTPQYECTPEGDRLRLTVFVPGVDSAGVDITTRGPDLIVTARKAHYIRSNFEALNLEGAQLDYELRLRLGRDLDYETLRAELADSVLTLLIPKRERPALAA
jgi:HSP20 family protein